MFDIEGTVSRPGSCDRVTASITRMDVLGMDVGDDLGQCGRLVRLPSVELAQLERPEDHVRVVIVIEMPMLPTRIA